MASCAAAVDGGSLGHVGLWESIRAALKAQGIDLEGVATSGAECCAPRVKVVCVAPAMRDAVAEATREARDQVVMVRVDEATSRALDAWVETGTVRSRSEAAAVFLSEGLKVRASELEKLRDAIAEVERARARLHTKVREVLGGDAPPADA